DSAIHPTTEAELNDIYVAVNQEALPLSEIASIDKDEKPTSILRKNGNEYIRITLEVDSQNLSKIANEIYSTTNEVTLPDGVSIDTGGAASDQAEQFAELFQLMAVSIG